MQNNLKLEERCNELFLENKELTKKYIALLEDNKKLEEKYNMHMRVIFDSQEDIDTYCDFDMLISQMKKQDQKFKNMRDLLEKALNYFENGCSDEDKWSIEQDIKKVLK